MDRRTHVRRSAVAVLLALATAVAAGVLPAAPAHADSVRLRVEKRLQSLGYPVGKVDGRFTAFTRLGLCSWRETHGMRVGRYPMRARDRRSVLAATSRPRTGRVNGLHVNETCQVLYQVRNGRYRRIVRASTGARGHGTPNGTGRVWRTWPGWHESSIYAGGWMLDTIYFRRDRPGIALHGVRSDGMVRPYPSSHGCVRLRQKAVRAIFDETRYGHRVRVYGRY